MNIFMATGPNCEQHKYSGTNARHKFPQFIVKHLHFSFGFLSEQNGTTLHINMTFQWCHTHGTQIKVHTIFINFL